MLHLKKIIATSTILVTMSGCVTTGNNSVTSQSYQNGDNVCDYNAPAFIAGGAVIGGVLGRFIGGNKNKTGGALLGALAGGLIGQAIQSLAQERCQKLALAQKEMQVTKITGKQITVPARTSWQNPDVPQETQETVEGLAIEIDSNQMFPVGKDTLTPTAENDIRKLTKAFKGTTNKILIIGHTDSTGSTELNQKLSEDRAKYVAGIFEEQGIEKSTLFYKGAGETDPVASNKDDVGRAKNRRVEIVELPNEDSMIAYEFNRDNKIIPSHSETKEVVQRPEIKIEKTTEKPLIDFGGTITSSSENNFETEIGKLENSESFFNFSLISSAYGNNENVNSLNDSCISTRFRQKGEIKTLSDGSGLIANNVSDHLPGLYGTSWVDQNVNGHLIGLSKVAVLRDSGRVPEDPTVFVYENFKPGDNKAFLKTDAKAEATIGEDGVLYRTFFSKKAAPLICSDVVFSRKEKGTSTYGKLFYTKNNEIYAADFKPKIINK